MTFQGSRAAVLFAQARHGGVFGGVAVLHPLLRLGPGAGAEIRADVRLGAEHLGVIQELVRAEAIAFDGAPRHFEARRPLVARADAVPPVVIGREIAAGPAQQRNIQLLGRVQDIPAKAVGVGEGRFLLEDAAIDAAPQVLDEIAVDLRIDIADDALGIDLHAGFQRALLRAQNPWRGEDGFRKATSGKHQAPLR